MRILLRGLTGEFVRQALRLRRHHPIVEVVLDTELLRLPAGAADEQWIAEIEEHLRGGESLQAPFPHVPRQLGPFG